MIDAVFYHDVWHGSIEDNDTVTLLLSRAEDTVNAAIYLTGLTVATVPERMQTAVYKAVCAQADYIEGLGGAEAMSDGAMTSATLGRFSYFGTASDSAAVTASSLCPLARTLLLATGLLYKGVRTL